MCVRACVYLSLCHCVSVCVHVFGVFMHMCTDMHRKYMVSPVPLSSIFLPVPRVLYSFSPFTFPCLSPIPYYLLPGFFQFTLSLSSSSPSSSSFSTSHFVPWDKFLTGWLFYSWVGRFTVKFLKLPGATPPWKLLEFYTTMESWSALKVSGYTGIAIEDLCCGVVGCES